MDPKKNYEIGQLVTKLIAKENLTYNESHSAFRHILNNEVSEINQGAFLASLTAKGETAEEVGAGWQAIYELDTTKISLPPDLVVVDNCGTGMDTFKTFNISTASALIGAADGVTMARHGARAISSKCGTVDMAELLGVDVECSVDFVKKSIIDSNIGLFNGMSSQVHPKALGRILSQISFGSPLNIAASLANPAQPKSALRGVYRPELIRPVLQVMDTIGYTEAIVVYGEISGQPKLGMDEASICGPTHCGKLKNGEISEFLIEPEKLGLGNYDYQQLAADPSPAVAAQRMIKLLAGQELGARRTAITLNASLIFLLRNMVATIADGIKMADELISDGSVLRTLEQWVEKQNANPDQGLQKLNLLLKGL